MSHEVVAYNADLHTSHTLLIQSHLPRWPQDFGPLCRAKGGGGGDKLLVSESPWVFKLPLLHSCTFECADGMFHKCRWGKYLLNPLFKSLKLS